MTAAATAARIIMIDVLLSVAESVGTSVAGVGTGDWGSVATTISVRQSLWSPSVARAVRL